MSISLNSAAVGGAAGGVAAAFCLAAARASSFFTWTAQAWGTFSTLVVPQVGQEISFLSGLLLEVFKARKPAFEAVFFLTQEIVNDHKTTASINKVPRRVVNPSIRAVRYSATRLGDRPE